MGLVCHLRRPCQIRKISTASFFAAFSIDSGVLRKSFEITGEKLHYFSLDWRGVRAIDHFRDALVGHKRPVPSEPCDHCRDYRARVRTFFEGCLQRYWPRATVFCRRRIGGSVAFDSAEEQQQFVDCWELVGNTHHIRGAFHCGNYLEGHATSSTASGRFYRHRWFAGHGSVGN